MTMHSAALVDVAEMKLAEQAAMAAGVPGLELMERAGRSVAEAITARWSARRVLVLCGPGNNGGDGFVVARYLGQAGWSVRVALLGAWESLRGDALAQAERWAAHAGPGSIDFARATLVPIGPQMLDEGFDLVVDALFGTGLARPLDGGAREALALVKAHGKPVVAVDIPSGVFGDTGEDGGAAPATLTVTFFRRKPAHALMPGRRLCGEVVVTDIGLEPTSDVVQPSTFVNDPSMWLSEWPTLDDDSHKYRRGHSLIYGGGVMTGAARLAARAAARVGSGLTTVVAPESAWGVYASSLTSIMLRALPGRDVHTLASQLSWHLADARFTAVLVGPGASGGLDESILPLVEAALSCGRPVVLDADALTACQKPEGACSTAIRASARPVVLTPHEGEFARLFPQAATEGGPDKLSRARWAAKVSGAVVVLKGPDTVVASPCGRAVVNLHASPALATAGSGDVLAGLITGLLAQGMPAWHASAAAVWVHGAAALAFGRGLIADDLPEQVPGVLQHLLG